MQLIDSHCHIPLMSNNNSAAQILAAAEEAGIVHMLCVSVDLEGFPAIAALATQHTNISASIGVHPNTLMSEPLTLQTLLEAGENKEVIAIGETGLDYFRDDCDPAEQKKRFQVHIQAAKALKKPLIIHCREAKTDVLQFLAEEGADEIGGVMHCFVEDLETARVAMALNFYISFSGIITFKNAVDLRVVAEQVPLERILIETDSPYLAPTPYRGKENQPAYVRYVAEKIAELKGLSVNEVATATTENFQRLFQVTVN